METKTRTTLILSRDKIKEAMKITGTKTKTDAVTAALDELIRRSKIQQILDLHGIFSGSEEEITIDRWRGRNEDIG